VPAPSTSIPPPSFTRSLRNVSTPACAATAAATCSSLSHAAHGCAPQPLNVQSTPSTVVPSLTNVGATSRAQASLRGAGTNSAAPPSISWATAASAGSTTIRTGSNRATARATATHAVRAAASEPPP
jgi:hypothetical protein